jgi:hypothetical protein
LVRRIFSVATLLPKMVARASMASASSPPITGLIQSLSKSRPEGVAAPSRAAP